MKRYLVFLFPGYYPGGGWGDFIGAHDTIDEAREAWEKAVDSSVSKRGLGHIVDTTTLSIVESLMRDDG